MFLKTVEKNTNKFMNHLTSKDATILINVALRTSQCMAVIQKKNNEILK